MAASNTLNDKTIKAEIKKAGVTGKPSTLDDGGGLSLIFRPDGAGCWRFWYWIDGRENRLSLGT